MERARETPHHGREAMRRTNPAILLATVGLACDAGGADPTSLSAEWECTVTLTLEPFHVRQLAFA